MEKNFLLVLSVYGVEQHIEYNTYLEAKKVFDTLKLEENYDFMGVKIVENGIKSNVYIDEYYNNSFKHLEGDDL